MYDFRKLATLLERLYGVAYRISYARYLNVYHDFWKDQPHLFSIGLVHTEPLTETVVRIRNGCESYRIKDGTLCQVSLGTIFEGEIFFEGTAIGRVWINMYSDFIFRDLSDPTYEEPRALHSLSYYWDSDGESYMERQGESFFDVGECIHPSVFEQIRVDKKKWIEFCDNFLVRLCNEDGVFEVETYK